MRLLDSRHILVLIVGVWFGVVSMTALANPGQTSSRPTETYPSSFQLTEQEKQWLEKQHAIRIGTMDAWPPMDFVDVNGIPRGIGSRYIEALNRRLENKLKVVPGPWDKIYNDTKAGRLDALMGITPRKERERFFNFTTPYLVVPHAIFAKVDSPYLKSLADLNGRKVAAEKGFFIVGLFEKKYPGVHVVEYPSTSDAMDALTKGEVDAYVGNRAAAMYIIESELFSNIKQHGKITETSSINAVGVRKDIPILLRILQKALDDIGLDEQHNILSKWATPIRRAEKTLSLTRHEQKWVDSHPVIRVAFDENYPPYSFRNKQGEFVGIAVDYTRELTERAGLKLEIYSEGQWDKLYAAAQQKQVDVIATLVKREERKQWFGFTRPYISLAQYIITRHEDLQSYEHPSAIAGKKIALIENYSMSKVLLEEYGNIQPYYVKNLTEALEAVSSGRADATIGAIGMANHLIAENGLANLGFASLYSKGQSEQRLGVRKDWPELVTILDKALRSLSDEEVIHIFSRWTQPRIAKSEAELFSKLIDLTSEEIEWLRQHPVIRAAADPNWAPIEFVDKDGRFKGISADYLSRLEEILDIKFNRVKDQTWSEMVENFKKGEIDFFTSLNRTPERRAYMNFTESYTQFPIAIFAGPDMPFVLEMKALSDKRVGVVKDYAAQELIETNYPEIDLVLLEDPLSALDALSGDEIDVYLGNMLVTNYYIAQQGYTHLKIVGKTPYQYDQSMGVRKDWPIFVEILNKALASIPEAEKNAIYNNWIGVRLEQGFDYGFLWKVLLGVGLLLFVILFWNRKLNSVNKQLVVAHNQEHKARELAEKANSQLQEMDKLKSMFIASMSHELRTPLNSIIGFSGLLLQGVTGELNKNQKDSMQRINRAGNHLLSLISDVIDISKIEAGRVDVVKETFGLKELVDEAVDVVKPMADEKSILIQIESTIWPEMKTDRKRLLQCLLNFLSNAIKYSERGTVRIHILEYNETVELSVSDEGIGISEKNLPKLFEAFERFDSNLRVIAGGTGLGLYLTKKITEDILQGTVSAVSKVDEGSTFKMVIPKNLSIEEAMEA